MRSPSLLPAALLLAVCAPAQADEPPPVARRVEATLLPEITSRLRSQDLATVAWGAHLAAEHRVTAAVPELLAKLTELRELPSADRRFVAIAVLDALVQTGATPPRDDLEPFTTGRTRAAAIALLARRLAAHTDWFLAEYRRLDAAEAWTEWLCCGNLLAEARDAAFTQELLGALQWRLVVEVRDRDTDDGRGAGRSGGGKTRNGDGRCDVPQAYPPTALYTLSLDGRRDDVLFAPGPKPVYLRRVLRSEPSFGIGANDSHQRGAHRRMRFAWLAQMLDQPEILLPLRLDTDTAIDWRGRDAFAADLRTQRAALVQRFRQLCDLCVEAHLLASETADRLTPTIEVELRDRRGDQGEPLPAVEKAANDK